MTNPRSEVCHFLGWKQRRSRKEIWNRITIWHESDESSSVIKYMQSAGGKILVLRPVQLYDIVYYGILRFFHTHGDAICEWEKDRIIFFLKSTKKARTEKEESLFARNKGEKKTSSSREAVIYIYIYILK